MSSSHSTLCCVGMLVLASCSNKTNEAAPEVATNAGGNIAGSSQTLYTIAAFPVQTHGPGKAIGKFHVAPAPSGGIATIGLGGACLVFQMPAASCRADSDCAFPASIADPDKVRAWHYCHGGQCWIKPSDAEECWKSSNYSPPQLLTIGHPVETPEVELSKLPPELFTGPAKDQVNGRVVACLNGKFVPGTKPPCAGGPGDVVEQFGPVRTLTK